MQVTGTSTQDIPFRMLNCLVAGLAYYLSLKIPEAANRIEMLKMEYENQWLLASSEDQGKSFFKAWRHGKCFTNANQVCVRPLCHSTV
jgi:hypothetical protein